MTICTQSGYACSCQPDEGCLCPHQTYSTGELTLASHLRAVCKQLYALEDQRDELVEALRECREDRLTLALRLYGESPNTFAPETAKVMLRMQPIIDDLLGTVAETKGEAP